MITSTAVNATSSTLAATTGWHHTLTQNLTTPGTPSKHNAAAMFPGKPICVNDADSAVNTALHLTASAAATGSH
jgi:hypothetical protein